MNSTKDRGPLLTILAVGALTAAGFVLRAWNLGDFALNPDEVMFAYTARAGSWIDVWRHSLANVHPPGNYLALHLLSLVSTSPAWLRSLSLVGGTLLIPLGYGLGKLASGRAAGLFFAGLIAFSPGLIELSRVCRNYSPAFALFLATLYFLLAFLQSGRWRDFYLFALFEFFAVAWLYTLVVPFAGVNLALVTVSRTEWRNAKWWSRVIGAQAPLAIYFALSYAAHISRIDPAMSDWMRTTMAEDFTVHWNAPFYPLIDTMRYLLGTTAGKVIFYFSIVSFLILAAKRDFRLLTLCAAPVLLALVVTAAGLLPMGQTRHSAYLFPFLYIPVVSILDGKLRNTKIRRASIAVASAIVIYITAASFAAFRTLPAWDPIAGYGAFQPERPIRIEQLAATLNELHEQSGPDDIVFVSYQSLLTIHAHLGLEPIRYVPESPYEFIHENLRFFYSPASGYWVLDSKGFLRTVNAFRAKHQREQLENVWTIRAGWEPSLQAHLKKDFPDEFADETHASEMDSRLFRISYDKAVQLAQRHAEN